MKASLISMLILFASLPTTPIVDQEAQRLKELDQYWSQLSKTVREGDHEGYAALYHKDAVIVFATRENKSSFTIGQAMESWKSGFESTKAGKIKANVDFRFSQRIGNDNTAHETGIFAYSSGENSADMSTNYVHFEMLLVKKSGQWLGTMEYQKTSATKEEWDALR